VREENDLIAQLFPIVLDLIRYIFFVYSAADQKENSRALHALYAKKNFEHLVLGSAVPKHWLVGLGVGWRVQLGGLRKAVFLASVLKGSTMSGNFFL
jgi:hypothetical protein